jgi:hypothetical protein
MIDNSSTIRAPTPFDLKAYISRYESQSETTLQRLLFLAHHFHNNKDLEDNGRDNNNGSSSLSSISNEAFTMAVSQMKSTGNYRRYLEEYGAIEASHPDNNNNVGTNAEHSSPELTGTPLRNVTCNNTATVGGNDKIIQYYIEYDPNFAPASKIDAQNQLDVLEGRLSTAQSHIMKESIRTALMALAEFHKKRGELREALRRVYRSRYVCLCVCLLFSLENIGGLPVPIWNATIYSPYLIYHIMFIFFCVDFF